MSAFEPGKPIRPPLADPQPKPIGRRNMAAWRRRRVEYLSAKLAAQMEAK